MNKHKTNEISTTYGRENLKVTCIERRYRIEDSKVSFIVNARKELDEDTTSKLLHEDMELKTFLANYEITNITDTTPQPEEIENTETVRENVSAKNSLKTVVKARIGKTHTIQDIMRKEPPSFKNESKDEIGNLSRDTKKSKIRYTTKGIREVEIVPNDEISKDIKENIPKDEKENVQKSRTRREFIIRRQLFDTINLPENFRASDYVKAMEKMGIKITNEAMPYDDLEWLEKQGKISRIDKMGHGRCFYKLAKKNDQENNSEEMTKTIVQ